MVYRPKSLLERLELLRQYGFISSDLHGSLQGLGGFRNVLAHEYVGLADATVHEHLVKMNGVFRALTRELEMLVESGDAG